ncbi:serine/threonine-protein kinase RsbW [Geothermobacter ehrlichii]|uniref:Serine/threonine-protein kinase RsbW n=1 Tax=Geothermobacter ehrlichii TaxID=213224 RepID=A0A5D3WKP2_9BACT|nr:ATP-binding protein [Geothermobacter ehrlichii]TYO99577.1 serine/threonine-protein kinase RsbW [Geothermobacter ehrlichii]
MERLKIDIRVPNQTRYLGLIGRIGEDIAHTLRSYRGDREELAYHINLVLTEAITNAIRHANEDDPEKEIRVCIGVKNDRLIIRVYDQGSGFDLTALGNHEFRRLDEHGRGVYIIRSLMDEVDYQQHEDGYVLEMIKHLR